MSERPLTAPVADQSAPSGVSRKMKITAAVATCCVLALFGHGFGGADNTQSLFTTTSTGVATAATARPAAASLKQHLKAPMAEQKRTATASSSRLQSSVHSDIKLSLGPTPAPEAPVVPPAAPAAPLSAIGTFFMAIKGMAALCMVPALLAGVCAIKRKLSPNSLPADWPVMNMSAIAADYDLDQASTEKTRTITPHLNQEGSLELAREIPGGVNPWTDAPWKDMKWTVYRGAAYDLGPFLDNHPGGNWLLNLAVRRDCTCLLESYHLRSEVAAAHMKRLPGLVMFPVEAVPKTPYPGDSALYNTIRDRVKKEIMENGGKGIQRTGSMDAAVTTTIAFFASGALYAMNPTIPFGILFGLCGAWCGMVTQHPGNHGALSTNTWVNNTLGLMADLVGGSGLCWQYHHNVSHHVHCNDEIMDEDVYSAYPVLRLDDRIEAKWYHKYQHLYCWPAFCFMHLVFFIGDFQALVNRRTEGAAMHGAGSLQRAIVLLLKVAHLGLLIGLPAYLCGSVTAVLPGAAAYSATWGLSLAILFAVSHNTNAQKDASLWSRGDDWAAQQIVTSADWGHGLSCWMTGGLSLQTVHHLFPSICAYHYPAIREIVEEECANFGVPYVHYKTFPAILKDFAIFMRDVGRAPFRQTPENTPTQAL